MIISSAVKATFDKSSRRELPAAITAPVPSPDPGDVVHELSEAEARQASLQLQLARVVSRSNDCVYRNAISLLEEPQFHLGSDNERLSTIHFVMNAILAELQISRAQQLFYLMIAMLSKRPKSVSQPAKRAAHVEKLEFPEVKYNNALFLAQAEYLAQELTREPPWPRAVHDLRRLQAVHASVSEIKGWFSNDHSAFIHALFNISEPI